MNLDDLRGTAYASIESLEAIADEMLIYIVERLRMTQTQADMLRPVTFRAVHQIARKMEFQPLIYGKELTRALGLKGPDRVRQWIERELGPGWIYSAGGAGAETMTLLCRASFFALMDKYKARKKRAEVVGEIETLAAASQVRTAPTRRVKTPEDEPLSAAEMRQRARREREKRGEPPLEPTTSQKRASVAQQERRKRERAERRAAKMAAN